MGQGNDNPAWHRSEVNQFVSRLESKFLPADKSAAIFIPLCGKALEVKYLHDKGYTIIGLEGSEKAIQLLSDESNFDLKESSIEGFGKVFTTADISIQKGVSNSGHYNWSCS